VRRQRCSSTAPAAAWYFIFGLCSVFRAEREKPSTINKITTLPKAKIEKT
jgi:hypothetical protein